uniref:BOS complex subunit TMEM147 n=1 Tax=Xiphophorus couchianus TaxID=32473 RepID=A0A3B5LWR8_9TELE
RTKLSIFLHFLYATFPFLFITANCNMLFLATFFPTWEGGAGVSDFIREQKADLKEVLSRFHEGHSGPEYKIMVAAMGWATAEHVMLRFLPLWVGARGIEFDWKYIQMSFDSNISLLLFTRYDLPKTFRLPVAVLLALCVQGLFNRVSLILKMYVLGLHTFQLIMWSITLVNNNSPPSSNLDLVLVH